MTTFLAPVKPGQLISADLFNLLLQKMTELQAGQGQVPAGSVIVPLVFGQTLENAMDILGVPALRLTIGVPIDAFGNVLDPDLPESKDRIVLGQIR